MPIYGKDALGNLYPYAVRDQAGNLIDVNYGLGAPPPISGSGLRSHLVYASENEAGASAWTDAQALSQARQYDVISVQLNNKVPGPYKSHYTAAQIASMKAANPNLKVIVYTNAGEAVGINPDTRYPDTDYAHDSTGAKIQNGTWGTWPMQADNADWIAKHIALGQDRMSTPDAGGTTVNYDGEMADVMGQSTADLGAVIPGTTNKYGPSAWLDLTAPAAAQIVSANPGKLICPNGLNSGTRYLKYTKKLLYATGVTMAIAEGFVRNAPDAGDARPLTNWLDELSMMDDASAVGKAIVCMTKDWTNATDTLKTARLQFAFATYLLGDPTRHYFCAGTIKGSPTSMNEIPWLSSTDYGAAQGARYHDTNNVYYRDFANASIAVNPTTTSRTVTVRGQSVTVAPQRAAFVFDPTG